MDVLKPWAKFKFQRLFYINMERVLWEGLCSNGCEWGDNSQRRSFQQTLYEKSGSPILKGDFPGSDRKGGLLEYLFIRILLIINYPQRFGKYKRFIKRSVIINLWGQGKMRVIEIGEDFNNLDFETTATNSKVNYPLQIVKST